MTRLLKLTPLADLEAYELAARRHAVMLALEEEHDLLCLAQPCVWRIGNAWKMAGVGLARSPLKRVEAPVTRRDVLCLKRG